MRDAPALRPLVSLATTAPISPLVGVSLRISLVSNPTLTIRGGQVSCATGRDQRAPLSAFPWFGNRAWRASWWLTDTTLSDGRTPRAHSPRQVRRQMICQPALHALWVFLQSCMNGALHALAFRPTKLTNPAERRALLYQQLRAVVIAHPVAPMVLCRLRLLAGNFQFLESFCQFILLLMGG